MNSSVKQNSTVQTGGVWGSGCVWQSEGQQNGVQSLISQANLTCYNKTKVGSFLSTLVLLGLDFLVGFFEYMETLWELTVPLDKCTLIVQSVFLSSLELEARP